MSCDCDSLEYEGEFCDTRHVKARGPYRCCECKEPIQPGERYSYSRGLFDGDFITSRTCLTCAVIRDAECPCMEHGGLWSFIHDMHCLGEDAFCICPS